MTSNRIILVMLACIFVLVGKGCYSDYKSRPPEVDAKAMIPGGLRTFDRANGRHTLTIPDYSAAGIASFTLAKNLDDIIAALGSDYLRDLKAVSGGDDGYSDWFQSPINDEHLKTISPQDAKVLTIMQTQCAASQNRDYTHCRSLRRAGSGQGLFYAYGDRRIVILDPVAENIIIAYAGPYTGPRQ